MSYSQSTKETIRNIADIVELIGQFVQLRKAGLNYIGLCPFHTEKTPSFTVSPSKQMFHCFGCKRGGDIFAFWMEYHGVTFPEALKELAERCNVPMAERDTTAEEKRKAQYREALFRVNEEACLFFHTNLLDGRYGRSAQEYLSKRSISRETIATFRLGYAPDSWDSLASALRKKFGRLETAVAAGLLVPKKSGGYYDRFRKRITFPIFNLRGRVVGFGGRVLDDSLPKYLNTPETPVFHKGSLLYGLRDASDAIRKSRRAVIVEGYMDFLSLKSRGLEEVVATLGTALTSEHVRRLKGYASESVLLFDADEAGRTAALKSLPLFLNEGLKGRAVALPGGHDPDSFINAEGLHSLVGLIQNAKSLFDFHVDLRLSDAGGSLEKKAEIIKEILPVLAGLHHASQQSLYVRRLSQRLDVKEDAIWLELKNVDGRGFGGSGEREPANRLDTHYVEKKFSRDLHFLNLLIHYPDIAQKFRHAAWQLLLSDPSVIEIVKTFFESYEEGSSFSVDNLLEELETEGAREQLREAMLSPSFYSDQNVNLAVRELEEKIQHIEWSRSNQNARQRGDIQDLNRLLRLKAEGSFQDMSD